MAPSVRPVSPHLQIYKPQLTSVMSILHRITGVLTFAGSICILVWLVSLAWDAALYSFLQEVAVSIPVQVCLFFWSLALVYHLLNGLRHLSWDAGKGFEKPEIYKSGKLVVGLSLLITIFIWVSKAV
ncbi:MAG: succinate dehydrogenase, cytochrome b556 subunit [Proteobacteria bacterium]|nr:succinate dehydrogenase, cytochrome b556 subunit [Pseudomonadota bacterium]